MAEIVIPCPFKLRIIVTSSELSIFLPSRLVVTGGHAAAMRFWRANTFVKQLVERLNGGGEFLRPARGDFFEAIPWGFFQGR